jgi:hypothetical protein
MGNRAWNRAGDRHSFRPVLAGGMMQDMKDWTEDAFSILTPEEAVALACALAFFAVIFKDYVL